MAEIKPKVFISYSWSSPGHRDLIRSYADRLIGDGIEIIIDQYDLSEGQDKYVFMEKMVTDPTVTHVIIFSDSEYARKADARKAGVGTEAQIISKIIYEKVDQKKFIPVVCECGEDNEPCLPTFLKSRIGINFCTPEKANENWEQLIRVLYGKPAYQKPQLGNAPSYLLENEKKASIPTIGKFNTLRDALINSKPTVNLCRNDYIKAIISFVNTFRIRENLNQEKSEDKILSDLHSLLPLRDQIIEWFMIETSLPSNSKLESMLIDFLEKLLVLKFREPEMHSWSDYWFDTQRIFIYELFLYTMALLIKSQQYSLIHEMLNTHYMLPESESDRDNSFRFFDVFYTDSEVIENRNKRLKLNRISLLADIIKQRATRTDITFKEIMQAELVILLVSILSTDIKWFPHTLVYSGRHGSQFPLFVRAAQHKYFEHIKTITGIDIAEELRAKFEQGCPRYRSMLSEMTFAGDISFWNSMNMDNLDTIK